MIAKGHEVTVVTGRRAYDDPTKLFPKSEIWRGIRIYRIASTGFGKTAKWRRAADFASFIVSCCLRLLFLPRPDLVIALTSPPLISFIAAWYSRVRHCRFVYWVMDLNPDEAIAAGWLRQGSFVARVLGRMSRFSLRRADRVIALDRFMGDLIAAKDVRRDRIRVIPPWSHDDHVNFDAAGRDEFRKANRLDGKCVVMYAGNHSPVHPLDTLLSASRKLKSDPGFNFCFVGGGSEWRKIKQQTKSSDALPNLSCLPYQPLEKLAGMLSAADIHVVVMGNPFVGVIHPCKIYNALRVGAPILYIGPRPSHLTEILEAGKNPAGFAAHDDVEAVIREVKRLRENAAQTSRPATPSDSPFSKAALLPQLVAELESLRA